MAFIKMRALGTRDSWSWFIGLGIGFLVLGALAIFVPLVASVLTTMLFGWLLVIGGILTAVHAVQNRRWAHSGWALVSAAIEIAAGLLVAFPLAGTATLTLVLAAFFAAEGWSGSSAPTSTGPRTAGAFCCSMASCRWCWRPDPAGLAEHGGVGAGALARDRAGARRGPRCW